MSCTLLSNSGAAAVCSAAGPSSPYENPEVCQDVEQQLEFNLEEIRRRYAVFVSFLCQSVIDKGTTVTNFRLYLMNLPALECDDNEEKHKLLYGVKVKLLEAVSIQDVFMSLSLECASFLNYDIFQCILDDYKISVENSDKLKYSEHLKLYLYKHKLSEFVKLNRRLDKFTDHASKKLALKFNIALPGRVTKVLDLKKTVAKMLRLRPSALQLVGIEEGCVLVTFLIPPFVADLTPEQIQKFQSLSVLSLKCGDQEFDLREKHPQNTIKELDDPQDFVSGYAHKRKADSSNEPLSLKKKTTKHQGI